MQVVLYNGGKMVVVVVVVVVAVAAACSLSLLNGSFFRLKSWMNVRFRLCHLDFMLSSFHLPMIFAN